jgi:hypothetical protein
MGHFGFVTQSGVVACWQKPICGNCRTFRVCRICDVTVTNEPLAQSLVCCVAIGNRLASLRDHILFGSQTDREYGMKFTLWGIIWESSQGFWNFTQQTPPAVEIRQVDTAVGVRVLWSPEKWGRGLISIYQSGSLFVSCHLCSCAPVVSVKS